MKTTSLPTADQVFRAVSDPTRLRILNLLQGGELCVCYIVGALRLPQPKVSRHLAYLRKAGLVDSRREGLWMHYRLASPANDFHQRLLDSLECCFRENPLMSRDRKRLDQTNYC
jgi:ArsR family transcriptional regulator, arsenate/arsenite/antimonite-responsive transcriptional repressor